MIPCTLGKVQVDYDKRFDVLYVALSDKKHSYGDDSRPGLVIMRDLDSDQITGFTVFSFSKRMQDHSLSSLLKSASLSIDESVFSNLLN